jgi:CHAT domain-containing protein/tetratricopeptide (TPR) repeat protein
MHRRAGNLRATDRPAAVARPSAGGAAPLIGSEPGRAHVDPGMPPMPITVVALLALLLAQDTSSTDTVRPGHAGFDRLPAGGTKRLQLAIEEPGPVTLVLESIDFDPLLQVRDGQDRELASDDDSGPHRGAWLALDVKPFVTYALVVASADGAGGRYRLEVRAGRAEPPPESDEEGRVSVHARFAGHAQAAGDVKGAAIIQYSAGEWLCGHGEYVLARGPLRAARALAQECGFARLEVAATAYLGACERRVGDLDEGIALLAAAWERRAAVASPGFPSLILENLGEAHLAKGELDEALRCFDAWAASATADGLPAFEALAHSRRGKLLARRGEREAAGLAHGRALGLLAEIEQPEYASQVLVAAGTFHADEDRYLEATELLERAAECAVVWDVQLEAQLALGNALTSRARYGQARSCLERAGSLLRDRADRRFELQLQVAAAELAFRTGDLGAAAAYAEAAIEGARARGRPDLEMEQVCYLGMLREVSGDLDGAGRLYEQALRLCGALDRPEREWRVHFDLGRLRQVQERYPESLELRRRALERAEALGETSARAACLNGIAYTRTLVGEHAEAHALAREALALWEQTGETDQVLRGPLHTLAVAALGLDRLDEADALLARADALIEREDVAGLQRLEAAGVRSAFAPWGELEQDLVARRLGEPDADRAALVARGLEGAGRWKARALLEGMPATGMASERLDALRARLGPDRVLVEYVRGASTLRAYVLSSGDLRLVDLGPLAGLDGEVQAYLDGMTDEDRLAGADEIARRGGALHARLLAPLLSGLDAPPEGLVVVPTAQLAKLPFEALVVRAQAEPGAPLGFDRIEFVADRHDVTYGPSVPVLARLLAHGPRRTPGRALVMGDPVYASETVASAADPGGATPRDPRTTGATRYARLAGTRGEVVDIAEALLLAGGPSDEAVRDNLAGLAALERERSGALRSRDFDLYLGADASAERLRGDLREYGILHIATHGEVDPIDWLRTGLVLAYDGQAHGHVTTLEILDLQLDADLVVLSACETARGRVLEGEGVQSLAYAFLQAGARAVVASLWSVDDDATRETMARFYEAILLDRRGGAAALRHAKALRQLKQRVRHTGHPRGPAPGETLVPPSNAVVGHPYYWAPFIWAGAIP